jgi:ArsR family transcriptional regulator, arsenate/arsenite/antimonite-responsive transcriptional repressor
MTASTRARCPLADEEEEAQTVAAAVEALQFLGDRNRLRILKLLAREELSVGELMVQLALPQPLVSYHLRRLRQAGLVQVRRQAKQVLYTIDPLAWEVFTRPIREVCDLVTMPTGGMTESTNTAVT